MSHKKIMVAGKLFNIEHRYSETLLKGKKLIFCLNIHESIEEFSAQMNEDEESLTSLLQDNGIPLIGYEIEEFEYKIADASEHEILEFEEQPKQNDVTESDILLEISVTKIELLRNLIRDIFEFNISDDDKNSIRNRMIEIFGEDIVTLHNSGETIQLPEILAKKLNDKLKEWINQLEIVNSNCRGRIYLDFKGIINDMKEWID